MSVSSEEKRREEKKEMRKSKEMKEKKKGCSGTYTVIRIFTVLDDASIQSYCIAVSTVIPGEGGGYRSKEE